jgi:hypothetical protein
VLIAYVDESGDTGDVSKGGASNCFALGCVVIRSGDWPAGFDHLLNFRRSIRDSFGPLLRYELKANHLIRNGGGLRRFNLSPGQRRLIYHYHLNQLAPMNAVAFAVVVDKARVPISGSACLEIAWVTLLQRLERTYRDEPDGVMIIHDQGDDAGIRKILRKSRRHMIAGSHFGGGSYTVPLRTLIEDPSPRASHESYFLQLADLVAYAGWRTYMPPGKGPAMVADAGTWSELGAAVLAQVNQLSRIGEPGVVIRY